MAISDNTTALQDLLTQAQNLPDTIDLSDLASVVGGGVTATEAAIRGALNDLIDDANDATSESDTTMTAAVQSLINGYGGGGSSFDYDVIEYAVTTDSSYNGTTYTIPHGLSYTPTWVVAVAVPQPTTYSQHNVAWLANEKTSGAIKQVSSNGRYGFAAANCSTSEDMPITNNGSIMADSENFYLTTTYATFDALKPGDTIYIITKNTGV